MLLSITGTINAATGNTTNRTTRALIIAHEEAFHQQPVIQQIIQPEYNIFLTTLYI